MVGMAFFCTLDFFATLEGFGKVDAVGFAAVTIRGLEIVDRIAVRLPFLPRILTGVRVIL